MNTELYLVDKSFEYQECITKSDLKNRIMDMANDYDYIRKFKTEKLFKHDSIYSVPIYENITVAELLYNPEYKKDFDRDTIKFLRRIIDCSTTTRHTISFVFETLLKNHSKDISYGLICLNKIEGIEDCYLIYNKHNWIQFHRDFLGIYPGSETYFVDECEKYFPQLFLHERNKITIKKILHSFAKTIIFHLSMLNDEFHKYKNNPYNRLDTLKRFSIACQFLEEASPEGNSSRKASFSFNFINNHMNSVLVCCEPHLKLCRSDNYPGDGKYYYYRIYFHEGHEDIQNGNILVGHIGEHL